MAVIELLLHNTQSSTRQPSAGHRSAYNLVYFLAGLAVFCQRVRRLDPLSWHDDDAQVPFRLFWYIARNRGSHARLATLVHQDVSLLIKAQEPSHEDPPVCEPNTYGAVEVFANLFARGAAHGRGKIRPGGSRGHVGRVAEHAPNTRSEGEGARSVALEGRHAWSARLAGRARGHGWHYAGAAVLLYTRCNVTCQSSAGLPPLQVFFGWRAPAPRAHSKLGCQLGSPRPSRTDDLLVRH